MKQDKTYVHVVDVENKITEMHLAKSSCKSCHGTGIAGKMFFSKAKLVCACVVKQLDKVRGMVNFKKDKDKTDDI